MTLFPSFFVNKTGGYEIEQSLRFNRADLAYLNRTPGSAGNRRTWTWSGWVKLDGLSNYHTLFAASTELSSGNSHSYIALYNDNLLVNNYNYPSGSAWNLVTNAVFRDPSAWYHIVLAVDTTQATASDRVKLYVNGEQVTSFSTSTYPSQNFEGLVNSTSYVHKIGNSFIASTIYGLDGYLAEVNFIDGSALDHEDFGELDNNGVWRPIKYTGSYTGQSWYLKFASGDGTDSSGLSNTWTANNFTTSGTGTDVMSDTPTTNWCTLNPLDKDSITLANGNLEGTHTAAAHRAVRSTFGISSGKWYWEITSPDAAIAFTPFYQALHVGIAKSEASLTNYVGSDAYGWSYWNPTGDKYTNGSNSSYGSTWNASNTIGVAFDADNGTLTFYRDNVSQGTAFTGLTSGPYFPAVSAYTNSSVTVVCNFGQRAFAYTPPTGYSALNTANLPAPDIADGSEYFNTVLYSGNSSTQTISGVGFQPDLIFVKARSTAQGPSWYNAISGFNKILMSTTSANGDTTDTGGLNGVTSDGFTLDGNNAAIGGTNGSGETYVAWNWLAGNGTTSNTDGSITSTVSANPDAGFSIVSYTGTGVNATVGHGLGVAPKMVIIKRRNLAANWAVYHASEGSSKVGLLDWYGAFGTQGNLYWNSTAPSNTVISIGTSNVVNNLTSTYIAYCFAEVEGYSKFGSFVGNGIADGPFVYTGFRPAFLLVKATNGAGTDDHWHLADTARSPYNYTNQRLFANQNWQENAANWAPNSGQMFDLCSNGFKVRCSSTQGLNVYGVNHIFMALSENPFGGSGVSPATAR